MSKRKKLYFILLGILLILYVTMELLQPRKIDWAQDYSGFKKIPFGCYVLKETLPVLMPKAKIRINYRNLYSAHLDSTGQASDLLIITDAFNPGKPEIQALLKFIKKGNTAFIAAMNFGQSFSDTLGFETNIHYTPSFHLQRALHLNFVNPELHSQTWYSFYGLNPVFFSSFDTLHSLVIGIDKSKNTVFTGQHIGKGMLYLTTKPEVFSNYHMLYSTDEYAVKALSYLQADNLIWDEYYKPRRVVTESQSPLRYILSQASLSHAYYLLLFTVLIFMIFESKRRQRIIPVLAKPVNSSLEFVETIGRLYLNQKDNHDLACKKIQYLYDFISASYFLRVDEHSEIFRRQFAEKAGMTYEASTQLFDEIIRIRGGDALSDRDLLRFINRINRIQYADSQNTK